MTPFIVTLTGPSCAGKTTLEKRLKDAGFAQVISTTTRAPRAGEVDGQSYYFISREAFIADRDAGRFIESVEFNGNFYAVSAEEIGRVSAAGKPIVVIVEPEGLKQVRNYCHQHSWDVYSVFIDNPGAIIAERFLQRMLADMDDSFEHEAVVATYANRLGVMLKNECWWAEDVGPLCDLWLHSFTERNIGRVVEEIRGLADNHAAGIDVVTNAVRARNLLEDPHGY